MGETVREGHFTDRWRVRRGGRLIFAENFRLDGPIAERLGEPAIAAAGLRSARCSWPRATMLRSRPCGPCPGNSEARSASRRGTASRWRASRLPMALRFATILS